MEENSGQIIDESAQPSPPRWKGAQSIGMVHRFNERCIEILCAVASSNDPEASAPVIAENLELWISLSIEVRRRLAKIPFVIVDADFKNAGRWRRHAESTVDLSLNERAQENLESNNANGLPPVASKTLMHEAMMFAWQLVGSDRTTAVMAFGMIAPVAKIIGELTPKDIRQIATREYSGITIRWANDAQLWRELLVTATAGDDDKLAALFLHAKLLLCGDLPQIGSS